MEGVLVDEFLVPFGVQVVLDDFCLVAFTFADVDRAEGICDPIRNVG